MENRSFMFLFPKERNHWELKCQHSSLRFANNETQLSGNQEPLHELRASDRSVSWRDKFSGLWGPHRSEG